MPTVVIIDDEARARKTIVELIKLYSVDVEVIGEADGVKSGVEIIQKLSPDIVLLDIQMADGTGFDLLQNIGKPSFRLIFITAFQEHAIRAFKFAALDYLLKPIDPDALTSALDRAKEEVLSDNLRQQFATLLENINAPSKADKKIVIKTAESIYVVNVNEILRCEADRNYTNIFFLDGSKTMVSTVLKEYDEILADHGFIRVHQSHLININHMKSYEKRDGGYIEMVDGKTVPVASRKRDHLMRRLNKL